MSTCRSCGAAIRWVRTRSGKPTPVDAKPEKRLVESRELDEATGEPVFDVANVFVSHFATCPSADKHRKPRGGSES